MSRRGRTPSRDAAAARSRPRARTRPSTTSPTTRAATSSGSWSTAPGSARGTRRAVRRGRPGRRTPRRRWAGRRPPRAAGTATRGRPTRGRWPPSRRSASTSAVACGSWEHHGVVERAVRLEVADAGAARAGERVERPDLVDDVGHELRRGHVDEPAAEAGEVAVADLGAHGDAARRGGPAHGQEHRRVAGVEAAGDVDARDDLDHRVVVAELPATEGLPDVGVEVDGPRHRRSSSAWRARVSAEVRSAATSRARRWARTVRTWSSSRCSAARRSSQGGAGLGVGDPRDAPRGGHLGLADAQPGGLRPLAEVAHRRDRLAEVGGMALEQRPCGVELVGGGRGGAVEGCCAAP